MPAAAARNLRHPSVQDEVAASPHAEPRTHTHKPVRSQPSRPQPSRSQPSRHRPPAHHSPRPRIPAGDAPLATPATVQDWQQVKSLVEHFNESDADTHVQETRAVHRLERRRHRPFHLSLISILVCTWMFGLLVALLWWNSRAISAAHHSQNLDYDIKRMRDEVAEAQRKISSLDSSPHLARWARERGWTQATSDRIDDVTKAIPPRMTSPGQSTPAAAETSDSGGERP